MPSVTRLSEDAVPTKTPPFRGFDITVDRSKLRISHIRLESGAILPDFWSGKGVRMSIYERKGLGAAWSERSYKGWNTYQHISVFMEGVTRLSCDLITVYLAPKRGLWDIVRCWQFQLTIVFCCKEPTNIE